MFYFYTTAVQKARMLDSDLEAEGKGHDYVLAFEYPPRIHSCRLILPAYVRVAPFSTTELSY